VRLFGTLRADCIKAGDRANRVTTNQGSTVHGCPMGKCLPSLHQMNHDVLRLQDTDDVIRAIKHAISSN